MRDIEYVVLNLGNEQYAIDIMKVHEINRLKEIKITKVPGVPSYVNGIINLRGEIVPIINLRDKLCLPQKDIDKESRIVIVKIKAKSIGILVDGVAHVIKINEDSIIPSLDEMKNSCNYIQSIGKYQNRIIFILDTEKILDLNEKAYV
jgi:purine-binding chemotaxis protein CheW